MTDETNLDPSKHAKFFIYGGLIIPRNAIVELHARIAEIRLKAGYHPEDKFKFETRARPEQVEVHKATKAKRDTVLTCKDLGCLFIVCLIHHEIARCQEQAVKVKWSCNHVIGRFNRFLTEKEDYGICLVDHLPIQDDYRFLGEKFTVGLDQEDGSYVPLERILLFGSTCIAASHLASAVDIVLGSFRYCINHPEKLVSTEMFYNVALLLWAKENDGVRHVRERGLILRPKEVRAPQYQEDYDDLIKQLSYLSNSDVL